MSMSKTKVALGTLLIFALGIFAGAFGANMYFKHRIGQLFSKDEPPRVVHLFMKRLSSELDLTEKQQHEIEAIVRQSHGALREVRTRFRPEIETIMNEAFVEIETKLDEEQQRTLREFREQSRFFSGPKGSAGNQPTKPLDRVAQRFLDAVDEEIALTEDQRRQVLEIVEGHMAELRELITEARDRRQPGTGELRTSLGRLNRQTENQLKTVLTEEQIKSYRKIWGERREELWDDLSRRQQARKNSRQ